MDKNEKKARKERLSKYVNLANGRFKDSEIEELESLVEKRDSLNGTRRTYRSSYKAFDSEDTYNVEEEETYTFCSDDRGIRVKQNRQKRWDDGQVDNFSAEFDTARDILNCLGKLFKK